MARSVIALWLCFGLSHSYASESSIVPVDNLKVDAAYAKENGMLLLILVTLPTCSICEYVKLSHIEPMMKAGDFEGIAVVRELSLEEYVFIDFDGSTIDSTSFVRRYKANFSPAVLFLAPNGEPLHNPIIGMSSRDYYGFYLSKAIKKSATRVSE